MNPAIQRLENQWDFERLERFAEEYGTPLYVTDLSRVRENYQHLDDAFEGLTVNYAVKANSEDSVLRTLRKEGAGAECASIEEVYRSMKAGYDLSDIQLTAVNPPEYVIQEATELSEKNPEFTITVGAMDSIKRLMEAGFEGEVFVRINPEIGAGGNETTATGADAKFGIPYDEVKRTTGFAIGAGLNVVGLHVHAGSGIVTEEGVDKYIEAIQRTVDIAMEMPHRFKKFDFGGGLGIPYKPEETELDLEVVNERIQSKIPESFEGEVILEPGRYIAGDAGVILTTVNTIKPTEDTTFVGVDASMTQLIRPAMFGSYHPITNVTNPEADFVEQTVGGPTCSGADVFAHNRPFPSASQGNVLLLGNTGAYGYVLASYFHSFPRAMSIVFDGEDVGVSMERETLEDVIEPQNTPDWV